MSEPTTQVRIVKPLSARLAKLSDKIGYTKEQLVDALLDDSLSAIEAADADHPLVSIYQFRKRLGKPTQRLIIQPPARAVDYLESLNASRLNEEPPESSDSKKKA